MTVHKLSLDNNDSFYVANESGCDFLYSQNCKIGGYEEIYFNPDCVLLHRGKREVFWFDLGYTNVFFDKSTDTRKHTYSTHNLRRKFAFSFEGNRYSMLDFTPLYSRVARVVDFTPQANADVIYTVSDEYVHVVDVDEKGFITETRESGLEKIWGSQRKVKIGLVMDYLTLIFPVRIAYRHGDVISFASKEVVVPDLAAREFSWENSCIGNICVSTDGSVSIYRQNKPSTGIENLLPTLCPKLSRRLSALTADKSNNALKQMIGKFLKRYWSVLGRYIVPYQIEHSRCRFSIFLQTESNPSMVSSRLNA